MGIIECLLQLFSMREPRYPLLSTVLAPLQAFIILKLVSIFREVPHFRQICIVLTYIILLLNALAFLVANR